MEWLLVLAYLIIGVIVFSLIDRFSTKYQQWYTVKREKQIILASLLFWPIILLFWIMRYLYDAFVGLLTFIKMIFD